MLYLIWAPNGQGKTYMGTDWACNALKDISKGRGTRDRVISNYPIQHKKYGSTLMWNRNTSGYNIYNALVIIDEAYRDYNSRDYRGFTKQEHMFFATTRHCNVDVALIVQGINRLDSVIREMIAEFLFVRKYTLPFSDRPLFFKVEGYEDEISIARRYKDNTQHSTQWIRFKQSVASAYDTHYYSGNGEAPEFISWDDVFELEKARLDQESLIIPVDSGVVDDL